MKLNYRIGTAESHLKEKILMARKSLLSLIFTTIFVLGFLTSFSQSPSWQWVNIAGQNDNDAGKSVAVDNAGNIYVAGIFSSATINFGNFTLTNNGITNTFVVKYDSSGNTLWAFCTYSEDAAVATDIALDNSGNIYLTGSFSGNMLTFGMDTLLNAGNYLNSFTTKLDNNGNIIWAKRIGGTFMENSRAIAVNNQGNILITGRSTSPFLTFANDTLINNVINHSSLFIFEYDSTGNEIWGKISTGGTYPNDNYGNSIASDSNGDWYVAGQNGNTISIDGFNLYGWYYSSFFILKCDNSGNVKWAKVGHSDYACAAYGIATDNNGNSLITGNSIGDSLMIENITLYNSGFFIAKYDSSGALLWAKDAVYSWDAISYGVALDTNGNIYTTGEFNHVIFFGTDSLTCGFNRDIFIAKFDSSGNSIWAKSAGGTNDDTGYAVAVDEQGNSIITGAFKSPSISFGNNVYANNNANTTDLFVAKIFHNILSGIDFASNHENKIDISPNPFRDILRVTSETETTLKLTIFDITSRKIFEKQFVNLIEVNTSQLVDGFYFYQVLEKDKVISNGKLLKN